MPCQMAEAKLAPVRPPHSHSARGGGTGQAAALRLQLTERGTLGLRQTGPSEPEPAPPQSARSARTPRAEAGGTSSPRVPAQLPLLATRNARAAFRSADNSDNTALSNPWGQAVTRLARSMDDPGEEEQGRRTGAGAAKWKSVRESQQLKANINAQRKLKERQKKGVAPGLESMKKSTTAGKLEGKLKAFLGDYEFSADTAVVQRQRGRRKNAILPQQMPTDFSENKGKRQITPQEREAARRSLLTKPEARDATMIKELVAWTYSVDIFHGLTLAQRRRLCLEGGSQAVKENEALIQAGHPASSIYVLFEGTCAIFLNRLMYKDESGLSLQKKFTNMQQRASVAIRQESMGKNQVKRIATFPPIFRLTTNKFLRPELRGAAALGGGGNAAGGDRTRRRNTPVARPGQAGEGEGRRRNELQGAHAVRRG